MKCITLDQGDRHLTMGTLQSALEGGARDAHTLGGLGLGQAIQVSQAQGLQLVRQQSYLGQSEQRLTGGLVDCLAVTVRQDAPLARARHEGLALCSRSPVLPSATALGFLVVGVLSARKVDDIGACVLGDGLELGATDKVAIEIEVDAGHGDDGETRLAGALGNVTALADKDLAHFVGPFVCVFGGA